MCAKFVKYVPIFPHQFVQIIIIIIIIIIILLAHKQTVRHKQILEK